jgi:Domain of unknown function (DUF309)
MEHNSAWNSEPATSGQHNRMQEAVRLFNRGDFFECHEVLEVVWLETSGDDKLFLQGLIQVAVSFYHLRRGNFPGSERLLRAGLQKLSGAGGGPRPIDVPRLLAILAPLPDRIEAGLVSPDNPAPVLEWRAEPGSPESLL